MATMTVEWYGPAYLMDASGRWRVVDPGGPAAEVEARRWPQGWQPAVVPASLAAYIREVSLP